MTAKHAIAMGAVAAAVALGSVYFAVNYSDDQLKHAGRVANTVGSTADSVELSEAELKSVKVAAVEEREFPIEKEAVGSIDFNEELLTQVFTPYQGRIIGLFAKVGDEVQKGQTLFTIDSPDLLQTSSTLISAAGVLQPTNRNLARLKMLFETRAISQKILEQAASDQT
jgi:membrane fusion protein, heavy metal efflux system